MTLPEMDTGKPLRGAVIGCGYYAHLHLRAWRELAGVEIAAVCDIDESRRRAAAKAFAIPRAYADAREMLRDERPDFVDVVTTMHHHRPLVELAAAAGIPVICQKPIAPDGHDARAMVAACRKAGIPLMIHENFRLLAPMLAVKQILDAGRVGNPFFARLGFKGYVAEYTNQPYLAREPRLILMDIGVHLADLARFFLGEVVSVACHTSRINPAVIGEDVATMLLRHRSGAASVLEMSFATRATPDLFSQVLVRMEGDRGTIDLGPDFHLTVADEEGFETRRVPPRMAEGLPFPACLTFESVVRTQDHWLECLRTGRTPDTSGEDNLKTLAIVEAAYRSAMLDRTEAPAGAAGNK